MLAPGRRRRRKRLVWAERHAPFAAVVAPLLLPVDVEGLLGFSGRRQDQRLPGFSRIRFRLVDERRRQQASCPNQKPSTIEHGCSPSFAHASESKDLLLPAWATSSFTTVAGQGWLAGPKPSLDAFERVATGGSAIKPFSPFEALSKALPRPRRRAHVSHESGITNRDDSDGDLWTTPQWRRTLPLRQGTA